ncbi:hypothetical protein AB0I34_36350 [Kribbella sp. NPDC050281]|uniref:hypothetical protein n=1 Tax=Kribbella sp. NPDC050281 TaxID=3155515 RepID=UPI00340CE8B2
MLLRDDALSVPFADRADRYVALSIAFAVIMIAGIVGTAAVFHHRMLEDPGNVPVAASSTPAEDPPVTESTMPTSSEPPPPTISEEPTPTNSDEPTQTDSVEPTQTTTPYSGNETVAVAPEAADHPAARAVVALLTDYFVSINQRNYTKFRSIHTQSERAKMSRDEFLTGYRSTYDSQVQLLALETAEDGRLLASVYFVSTQDAEDGRNDQTCTQWNVGRFLEEESSHLRIGKTLPGQTKYSAC